MEKKLETSRCVSGKSNIAERTRINKIPAGNAGRSSKIEGLDEELIRIMRTRRPRSFLTESGEDDRPPGVFYLASEDEASLKTAKVDEKKNEENLSKTAELPITTGTENSIAVAVDDRLVQLNGRHFLVRELDPTVSDREELQVDKQGLKRLIQASEILRRKYCGCHHPPAPEPNDSEDELSNYDPGPLKDNGVASCEPPLAGAEKPGRDEKVMGNAVNSSRIESMGPGDQRNLTAPKFEAEKKRTKSDDRKCSEKELEMKTAKENSQRRPLKENDGKLEKNPQKTSCPLISESISKIGPAQPAKQGDQKRKGNDERAVEVEPDNVCANDIQDKKTPKLIPSKNDIASSTDRYVKPRRSHRSRKPSAQNATCKDCIVTCGCADTSKGRETLVKKLDLAPKFKTERLPHGVILHIKFCVREPTGLTRDVHAIFDMPNYQLRRVVVDGAEFFRV